MQKYRAVAVTGPTACGKTGLAVALARRFGAEIISVDSRQVYRGMDIGTGKDLEEYGEVPHHLIDVADPGEIYDLARFRADAIASVADISSRGKLPLFCGGTALYLDSLLRSYELTGPPPDPGLRGKLDAMDMDGLRALAQERAPEGYAACAEKNSRPRLRRLIEKSFASPAAAADFSIETLVLGVYHPREEVRLRIEERLDARLASGMVAEVAGLVALYGHERMESFGLEYREIARHLRGDCPFDVMRSRLLDRIRQFAKRQDIFFRKMERSGVKIYWLRQDREETARLLIEAFLAGKALPEPDFRMSETFYGRKSD